MTYATPNPDDVATYVTAEQNQTNERFRTDGHVTIPCQHCSEPIRAAGGDPDAGWFHDAGEDACETCDCSEDYGPCEDHMDVIAQREGASTRTADDLVYVFLTDVLAIAEDDQYGYGNVIADGNDHARNLAALREAESYWSNDNLWTDNMGCRWTRDDVDAEIHDEMYVGESVLADLGLSVYWEDGYVITRITGGPLSED